MAPSLEPSEEAIAGLRSLSLSREDAIKWLRAYNNDTERAANAYFDNPNAILDQQSQVKYDERWDEGQFHTDTRDNAQLGQSQVGVRPADTLNPSVFGDAAPSRPPSRVSTRATMAANRQHQDLAIGTEDEQVNRAMAMSMNESQTLPDQRAGGPDSRAFGPATRDNYDTDKWALTFAGPQTQEILLNPNPEERKRPKGAPAFLKPSSSGHQLPALLKILHAVPMAREALLHRKQLLPDYGFNKEWWDGTAIQHLRIVNVDLDGTHVDSDDILYEVQRLMAFLDETQRAYGSTEVLTKLAKEVFHDKVLDFFSAWDGAASCSVPDGPLVGIFKSKGTKTSTQDPEMTQTEDFYCLVARIDDEISGKGLTLYDALDHILWADTREGEETYLEKLAEIFVFEISNLVAGSTSIGIEIPAIWYADRYLPSCTKQAKDMLHRKASIESELEAKQNALAAISQFANSLEAKTNGIDLMSKAIEYLEQTATYRAASDGDAMSDGSSQTSSANSGPCEKITEQLKVVSYEITQRLKDFEDLEEAARANLKELSRMYTIPSQNSDEPPFHKYSLRGLAINTHTVYVLDKTAPEDSNDILSTEAKDWQWWKIVYLQNDDKPVMYTKVFEEDVLKAASTESPHALLIYATEKAVTFNSQDLPTQLHNFVRADNLTFTVELEEGSHPKPATPTKRKMDDEDSDDLNFQYPRSPPHDRSLIDINESIDDNVHNIPRSSGFAPPGTSSTNHVPNGPVANGSYDNIVPTTLQARGSAKDSSPMILDRDFTNESHEMQERLGGQSFLPPQKGNIEQYTLGSYAPEIVMEDEKA